MGLVQTHHIISLKFASDPVIKTLTNAGLFDIEGSQNLLSLPANQELAAELGVSPHTGGHLSSYYDGIEQFLGSQNSQNLTPQQLSGNVNQFINAVRTGLATGQLYTNTPLGQTPEQTNTQNRQFYQNLLGTSEFTAVNAVDFPTTLPGFSSSNLPAFIEGFGSSYLPPYQEVFDMAMLPPLTEGFNWPNVPPYQEGFSTTPELGMVHELGMGHPDGVLLPIALGVLYAPAVVAAAPEVAAAIAVRSAVPAAAAAIGSLFATPAYNAPAINDGGNGLTPQDVINLRFPTLNAGPESSSTPDYAQLSLNPGALGIDSSPTISGLQNIPDSMFSVQQPSVPTWYSDYSQFYSDTGGASFSGDNPVVLDLTGNGINITQQTSSNTFFDMTGSGRQSLTAWAGAGNGVLFFDPTGNGQLTQANQIVFTDWDPSATSDMQALLDVFDTNHDGALDAGDANFANFFVMETNADGTQTAHSLASLGITSINLNANATHIALPDGSSIDGETTYTTASGATREAATVTFATDSNGYAVTTTTTTNVDGSVTIDNAEETADGSIASQRILNTLIATNAGTGVTTTTRTLADLNNGGVVTALQTDDTVAASGTTTETLTNYMGGQIAATGALTAAGTAGAEKLNSTTTTTTTNAGATVVTILRDQTGGGTTTQQEVDTTNANGSASYVVSDLNPDGSASSVETTTVSSDGLTRNVTTLVDGNSALSTTSNDATVVQGSTRTETVTDSAGTTVTSLVQTVTQTTATSVTRTTTRDLTDGSTLDLTTVAQTVTNADGSTTTTQTDTSANNTLLDRTVTTNAAQSGGGLLTTVTSSELDGNGSLVEVDSKATTISNAGATATTTVVDDSANGTLRAKTITTSTVGSPARAVTTYGNGDGAVTQSEVVQVNGATTTDTLENLNADGSLVNATVTTTTIGGLSKTTQVDSTGAGTAAAPVFDHLTTDVTTASSGASTETVTDYGASLGNPIDRTQTVVSANGLDTTVSEAFTSASLDNPGTWDQISTDQTTVNADGSLSETATVTDGAGAQNVLQTTQKKTSADRLTVTTTTTLGATGLVKTVETVTTENDGAVQDQTINFDQQGDVIDATVTTTSADGLTKTVQKDVAGQSAAAYAASGLAFDSTTTDTTIINPDGSRTETVNVNSGDGGTGSTLLSTSTTLTSANGLTVTTTADPYATPHFATQTVDTTTLNADGSKTEEVKDYSFDDAPNSSSTSISNGTIVEADGSTWLTQVGNEYYLYDSSGSGPVLQFGGAPVVAGQFASAPIGAEQTASGYEVAFKRPGSDSYSIWITDAAGNWISTIPAGVSGSSFALEALEPSFHQDLNGDGTIGPSGTTVIETSGSTWLTQVGNEYYLDNTSGAGPVVQFGGAPVVAGQFASVPIGAEQTASGYEVAFKRPGSDSYSIWITDAAGNWISTIPAGVSGSSLALEALEPSFHQDLNGDGVIGPVPSTVDETSSLIDETRTTTSADGLSTTVRHDFNGDGITDQASSDVTIINADGSRTEVLTDYTGDINGTVRDVATTHSGIIVGGAGLETVVTRQSNGSVPSYQVETILPSASGTVTDTTQTYAAVDEPLLRTTTVTTSANGLTKTTATAINGDATADFYTSDSTALSADGDKIETVASFNKAGLTSETVTITSANGLSTTTEVDADGAANASGAIFNLVTTDTTTLGNLNGVIDGSRTETLINMAPNAAPNGTTISKVVTNTSADKQTTTIQRYLDETGTIGNLDQTELVQTRADGSKIDTTTTYDAANALLGTVIKTTSGNGLSTSTTYQNAAGATVDAQTSTTSYDANGDGGTLEDREDADVVNSTTTLRSSVKTQTSGNQQNKTITMLLSGALASASVPSFSVRVDDDVSIADTGITTETIIDLIDGAASANDTTVVQTSADGRVTITSTALAGNASPYIVDGKAANLDGSQTEITTYYDPASLSTIETQKTVVTSWDGNTVATTTQSDFDGTHYNVVHDTVVKNADGTTTETRSGTGSFGAPAFSQTITTATNADASETTTTLNYDATGKLIGQTVADVSANGLTKSFVYDTTGLESLATLKTAGADLLAGTALPTTMLTTDIIALDTTTLNADGSKTEVVETASGDSFANLRTLTTSTTSANGLTTVTKVDNDGNGVFEQVDTRTVAPDGSTTDVVNYYGDTAATASTLTGSTTTTTSANGLVTTLTTSSGITDTTVTFADANGSYQFAQTVAANSSAATQGYAAGSATHDIDANGIDTWSWNDGSTGGSSGQITIDVATESQDVAIANQIYMTLLGRDMDQAETQYLGHYITNGVLDRQALAQAIVNDAKGEYANDFYDVLNYELGSATNLSTMPVAVIAAFENSFGRMPTAQEMATFGAITGPGDTPASNIAAMAVAVAQYASDQGSTNLHTLIDPSKGLTPTAPSWINPASAPAQGTAATLLGSSLGQALGNGNTFAQLAQGTAIQVVANALAPEINGLATNPEDSIDTAADNALATISPSLSQSFASAGLGTLSSFLTGELAQGLGLNGTSFGDQLLRSVSGTLLSTALTNIANGASLFNGLSGSLESGVSSFLGGYLAHEIVQPENAGGALGGALLGTLGSLSATTVLGSVGAEIVTALGLDTALGISSSVILGVILPGIGAFIGTLLGTLLGNLLGSLFGGSQNVGNLDIDLQPGQQAFGAPGGLAAGDVGAAVQSIAQATQDVLNQYIAAIGGQVISNGGISINIVGSPSFGPVNEVTISSGDRSSIYADTSGPQLTSEQEIGFATINALRNLEFVGGDMYMKRVLNDAHPATLEELAGDMQVAQDYERYLANQTVIDNLIALNPDSTFAAGWLLTLMQAQELGITQISSSDFVGGVAGFLQAFDIQRFGATLADVSFTVNGGELDIAVKASDGGVESVAVANYASLDGQSYIGASPTGAAVTGGNGNNLWIAASGVSSTFIDGSTSTSGNNLLIGTGGNETIHAGAATNLIVAGSGNDTIYAGSGTDTIAVGSGHDTIVGGTGTSTVAFSGPRADYVIAYAQSTQTFTITDTRGIDGTTTAIGVTSFAFTDATVSAAELSGALAPVLSLQPTSADAGTAIAVPLALSLPDPGATVSITVAGVPAGSALSAGTPNADATWTLTPAQLSGLAVVPPSGTSLGSVRLAITATATAADGSQGSATLQAIIADGGNDALDPGGAGADTMVGGAGNDTFVYGLGYGSDIINNLHTAAKTDAVMFGPGIAASALSFVQNGNDLLIKVAGQSGTLTIQNWFLGPSYQIGSFVLANGTAVTPTITVQGSASNDTLMAGPYETLLGAAENDTYVFDRGAGSISIYDNATTTHTTTTTVEQLVWQGYASEPLNYGGLDEYYRNLNEIVVTARRPQYSYDNYGNRFRSGYIDSVNGYQAVAQTTTQTVQVSNGANTLQFGPGIAVTDIEVKASGNDLIIAVKDPNSPNATFAQLTDKVRIQNWINPLNQVQTFKFADGSTLGVAEIVALGNGAVIGPPTLSVQSASGSAGSAIPLSIASALTSTDGTETLSVNVAGLPSGAVLSAGTHNADGSWTLTPAQLANLTFTAPAGSFAGTANLAVTATASEPDGSHMATSATLAVAVAGVASAPTLNVASASGEAGSIIALTIASALAAADGTETLAIKIAGVPSAASLTAGTKNADGSWTLTPSQLSNLSLIAPPAGSFAGTANLTVTATATESDGSQASTSASLPVAIAGVATAPTLTVQSAAGSAGGAIPLSIASALTSTDGTETLSINIAGLPSGATLSAGTPHADGSWTLTPAQLANLTLTAPAGGFAGIADLTVTATATEPDGSSALTTAPLSVVIAGIGNASFTAGYTEQAAGVTLSSGLSLFDPNDLTFAAATVQVSGGTFANDGDVLGVNTAGTAITASYNAATETLLLSGTDTLADYQSVLDSVTFFDASDNPTNFGSNATRTVTWTVGTGASASAPATTTLDITAVNDPPTLSGTANASFTEKGAAVTLSGAAAISDPDSQKLASATVALTGGALTSDVLTTSTTGTSITASYNSTTETLTLTGSDTLANYQQVLDRVTFNSTSVNPTSFGTDPARTVTWTLNDGSASNAIATTTTTIDVTAVNDAPTLSAASTVSFISDQTVILSPGVVASDPDSQKLASATVAVAAGAFAGDGDVLSVNGTTSGTIINGTNTITVAYNSTTETLVLTGSDTLADYQAALDKVTFASGANPTNGSANLTRTVTWTVNDGSASNAASAPATTTISIAPPLTPPTLSSNAGTPTSSNTVIPWFITATPADPTETVSYKITGMPASATLPVGTKNADGSWTVTAAQLPSLGATGITLPAGSFTGAATLTVTATATTTGGAQVSSSAQLVVGDGASDTLTAGSGTVTVIGGGGNDTITASSQDTVVFSGNHADYTISYNAGTGTFTLSDQRTGAPDGIDTVTGTHTLQFADGTAVYDSAGLISTLTMYDRADVVGWNTFQTNYDTSGNITTQHGVNEGNSSWTNVYDVNNAFSWSYYVDYVDGNGNLVSHTVMNDDQTSSLTAYNYDPNAAPWRSFTYNYRVDVNSAGVSVPWMDPVLSVVNYDGTTTLKSGEAMAIAASLDTLTWYANPYVPPPPPGPGGGGDGLPVLLGLSGNGINVVPLGASTARFDMIGDGTPVPTAWAGAGDGILAINLGPGGQPNPVGDVIDQAKQIEFTQWAPGTTSDMAALEQAFDTNHNGMLDPGDADWNDFRVWVNSDGVGTGQVYTLAQLDITSINLEPSGPAQQFSDGSVINGTTTYTMADGTTGLAGDVALAYDAATPQATPTAMPNPALQPAGGNTSQPAGSAPIAMPSVDDRLSALLGGPPAGSPITVGSADSGSFTLSNGSSGDAALSRLIGAMAAYPGGNSGIAASPFVPAIGDPNQHGPLAAALR